MSEAHVLLVNLGTPERPDAEAVREFLAEFLADPMVIDLPRWLWSPILHRMVLRSRPERVARLYQSIWYTKPCADCPREGCSPLECGTRRLAESLRAVLGDGFHVDWAYRYGRRSIARALELAAESEATEIVLVPLFPQRTCSTSGSILEEAHRVGAEIGIGERMRIFEIPPDAPYYVEGLADRCRTSLRRLQSEPEHVLVSFHGIPTRYDRRERGVYSGDCERTTRALLQALQWDPQRATLCYQSKFGPEPWLKPATADRIETLAREGVRRLAIVTPGFLTEGLETLEEIAEQGRHVFLEAGGRDYAYLPAVEDAPGFVAGLAAAIREPEN